MYIVYACTIAMLQESRQYLAKKLLGLCLEFAIQNELNRLIKKVKTKPILKLCQTNYNSAFFLVHIYFMQLLSNLYMNALLIDYFTTLIL